jgi:hypothetical protein
MVKFLGGAPGRIYLLGCEAGAIEFEEEALAISDSVTAAIPLALEMVQKLVTDIRNENEHRQTSLLQQ